MKKESSWICMKSESCDIEESTTWFRGYEAMCGVVTVTNALSSRFRHWIKLFDSSILQFLLIWWFKMALLKRSYFQIEWPVDPLKSTSTFEHVLLVLISIKVAQNKILFPKMWWFFFCSNHHLSYADNGQQKIMWGIWMKYCTRVGSKMGTQTKK